MITAAQDAVPTENVCDEVVRNFAWAGVVKVNENVQAKASRAESGLLQVESRFITYSSDLADFWATWIDQVAQKVTAISCRY